MLKDKADAFVTSGDLPLGMARLIIRTIEDERGKNRIANEGAGGTDDETGRVSEKLRMEELQKELDKRVALMREGSGGDGVTDQGRVYDYIVGALERGEWLRLMVQASAGTGAWSCIRVCL